jgi:hypothetical protein
MILKKLFITSISTTVAVVYLQIPTHATIEGTANSSIQSLPIPSEGFSNDVSLPIDLTFTNTSNDILEQFLLNSFTIDVFDNDAGLTANDDILGRELTEIFPPETTILGGQTLEFTAILPLRVDLLNRAGDELFEGSNLEILLNNLKVSATQIETMITFNSNNLCPMSGCFVTPVEAVEVPVP